MVVASEGPVYHSPEEDMNTTEETVGVAGTPAGIRNGYIAKQNLKYYCSVMKVILRQTEFWDLSRVELTEEKFRWRNLVLTVLCFLVLLQDSLLINSAFRKIP